MNPATLKLDHFDEIWGVDFEFSCPPGERPQLACLVAIEFKSGRRIRVWKDELATMKTLPYSIGPRSLFVAFTATAEFSCHLALGWELPVHVLDLYSEFRVISNGKPTPCGWGLLGAMAWYGLDTITAQEKEDMRALAISIAEGTPYTEKEKQAVLDYCESDVLCLIRLLPRMEADISLPHALLRGRYMKAAARIEYNGTPIDTQLRDRLLKNWDAIQTGIIAEVDQQYGVYEGTHFKEHLFEGYLARNGIPWPRTGSVRLSRDTKTFEKMADIYPDLKPLRILMDTISQMRSFKLAVGMDGRNRCGIRTFWAKTSRNQPKASEFIFLASKWLRGMIRPEPGFGLAYIDWGQQEIGIAAKLSGDQKMMAAYQSGDPYLEFAKEAGAAPKDATKKMHKAIRNHFKSCPRHSRGEMFVKGPIPWNWLVVAAHALPRGKALHVAIVLWFQAHLQNSPTVKSSATRLRELGVDRHAGYRALDALEKAELVKVVRHPGRLPAVTLLDSPAPSAPNAGGPL